MSLRAPTNRAHWDWGILIWLGHWPPCGDFAATASPRAGTSRTPLTGLRRYEVPGPAGSPVARTASEPRLLGWLSVARQSGLGEEEGIDCLSFGTCRMEGARGFPCVVQWSRIAPPRELGVERGRAKARALRRWGGFVCRLELGV